MLSLKKFLPKRIFARAILIIAAPLLLLQVAVIYLTLERYWNGVTQKLANITASEIAAIVHQFDVHQFDADQFDQKNSNNVLTLGQALKMEISFTPQTRLPQQAPLPLFDFLYDTMKEELAANVQKPIWIDAQTLRSKIDIRVAVDGGVLRILVPRNRAYAEKSYLLVTWTAGIAIILLAVAIIFLRNQVRPIQRLAAAANRFGRGLDVHEFKPSGASEVRQASIAFLKMRDRLRRHVAQRTEMLSAISHDMRTPLTRFKLQIALLPKNLDTDALKKDVAEMEGMIHAYLDFARGEGQEEKPAHVNIDQMLREMTAHITPHSEKKIVLNTQSELAARLRPQAIRRCLNNLISNALAYADCVSVSAARQPNGIEILIDDDGPGIPPSQYEEAFRPFQRLDRARNQNIPGSGLGLAIARDIARAAGGDITLGQSPQRGLRARLFLPA